jgi:hypothetical protein
VNLPARKFVCSFAAFFANTAIVSKDEPKRVITAHLDRKLKGKL